MKVSQGLTALPRASGNAGAKAPSSSLRGIAVKMCAVGLLLAGMMPIALATTLLRMSLAQMTQASPLIVRAECVANSTAWDAGEIWTFTTFQVREIWRTAAANQAISPQITVRLLGGTMGNLTSHVSGIPRFRPGEEAVLFLEPTARGDYSIVSWEQGTFRVRRNASTGNESVTQDSASFATFDPVMRRFVTAGIRGRPLAGFRAEIDAALAPQPGKIP